MKVVSLLSGLALIIATMIHAQEPPQVHWRVLQGLDYQTGKASSELQKLDGKVVQIPGFVVPLEGTEKAITEFLLVPTFGACIHVPPPPPNQVVYVIMEKGVPIELLMNPVWVTGQLKVMEQQTDLADAGYLLSGIEVKEFIMDQSW